MDKSRKPRASVRAFLWQVWEKAREIEDGEWLAKVGGELVPNLIAELALLLALGVSANRRLDVTVILGAAFVALAFRMGYCLLRAAATLDGEKDKEITRLKAGFPNPELRGSVVISRQKSDKGRLGPSHKRIMFRLCVYLEPENVWAKNLRVTIVDIEPLVKSPEDNLGEFRNLPLMRMDRPAQVPPLEGYKINPGDKFFFDLIKKNITKDQQRWAADKVFVCHAKEFRRKKPGETERNICGHDLDGNDLIRHPNDGIQKKDYDITIRATADQMAPCVANFKFSVNGDGKMALKRIS